MSYFLWTSTCFHNFGGLGLGDITAEHPHRVTHSVCFGADASMIILQFVNCASTSLCLMFVASYQVMNVLLQARIWSTYASCDSNDCVSNYGRKYVRDVVFSVPLVSHINDECGEFSSSMASGVSSFYYFIHMFVPVSHTSRTEDAQLRSRESCFVVQPNPAFWGGRHSSVVSCDALMKSVEASVRKFGALSDCILVGVP